jgi:hypothetical protein
VGSGTGLQGNGPRSGGGENPGRGTNPGGSAGHGTGKGKDPGTGHGKRGSGVGNGKGELDGGKGHGTFGTGRQTTDDKGAGDSGTGTATGGTVDPKLTAGVPAPPGATPGLGDPDRTHGGSTDPRPPGDAPGGKRAGNGTGGHPYTSMDKFTRGMGYANFDPETSKNGESGGIPGGKGTHNLGIFGQALFALVVFLGYVGAGKLKPLLKGLGKSIAKLFTKELWKQLGSRIASRIAGFWAKHSIEMAAGKGAIRFLPIHAAWRAGGTWLHAYGGKPLYYLSRLSQTRSEIARGVLSWNKVFSLQRVSSYRAEGWVGESARVIFRAPALVPSLAESSVGKPVLSCVTSAWNAWSRSNLHIPNLAIAGGAAYAAYRYLSGDRPQGQGSAPTNTGGR